MIIGLVGKKGAGKSTIGKFLEPRGFKRVAFAGPLKEILSKTFDIPLDVLNDPSAKENYSLSLRLDKESVMRILANAAPYHPIPFTVLSKVLKNIPDTFITNPRQLMQVVGTDVFRNYVDKDYWLRCFENQILIGQDYVCEDVRFPNELDTIKNKLLGKIVVVERSGPHIFDPHISEQLITNDYDYKINNNQDMETLKGDAEQLLALLKGGTKWQSPRIEAKPNITVV